MKTIVRIIGIIVLCLALFVLPAYAGSTCSTTNDAENLYAAGKDVDAANCLKAILEANGLNDKAAFLLGKYYFLANLKSSAERYWSHGTVKAKYSKEIAALYRTAGFDFLASFKTRSARDMFDEAERWQRGISLEIANELLVIGKQRNNIDYLEAAIYLNDSLREDVADYLFGLAEEAKRHNNENEYTRLINMAAKIHGKYSATAESNARALADNLFALALKEARQADLDANGVPYLNGPHEQLRRQYKQTAITILDNAGLNGKAIAEKMVPELRKFSKGPHDLGEFEANEQTPYWMTVTGMGRIDFEASNKMFIYMESDGNISRIWDRESLRRANNSGYGSTTFRVIAVKSVGITLVVK